MHPAPPLPTCEVHFEEVVLVELAAVVVSHLRTHAALGRETRVLPQLVERDGEGVNGVDDELHLGVLLVVGEVLEALPHVAGLGEGAPRVGRGGDAAEAERGQAAAGARQELPAARVVVRNAAAETLLPVVAEPRVAVVVEGCQPVHVAVES